MGMSGERLRGKRGKEKGKKTLKMGNKINQGGMKNTQKDRERSG
jgi:hypothetical protein